MFGNETGNENNTEKYSGNLTCNSEDNIFSDSFSYKKPEITFETEDKAIEEQEEKIFPAHKHIKTEDEKEFDIVREIYEWVEAIAYSLVIVVLIFTFLLRMVWVDGSSMNKTLYNGDRVIISNFMYEPKYKDIVVVTVDDSRFINKPLIKRIIALENQTVDFNRQTGKVIVDGKELEETYIAETTREFGNTNFPLKVPEGKVFVMGDNRNASFDSRYVEIGTIDVHHILGRVILRVYPFNKFGSVK